MFKNTGLAFFIQRDVAVIHIDMLNVTITFNKSNSYAIVGNKNPSIPLRKEDLIIQMV